MEQLDKLQIGDVVELNSGGPNMTVTLIVAAKEKSDDDILEAFSAPPEKRELVHTTWFVSNKKQDGIFPAESLLCTRLVNLVIDKKCGGNHEQPDNDRS